MPETPKIRKAVTTLCNECYRTASTSLTMFHFEPHPDDSLSARIRNCSIQYASIEKGEVYILDGLFSKEEAAELRAFSSKATFSRNSYGSHESIAHGEKPARSMNGRERWQFFSRPPQAVQELYKLLSLLAHHMEVDIATLPWELCDEHGSSSPSVIANFLEEASQESMRWGMHQDCHPEKGIPFHIPVLYAPKETYHAPQFVNGETGKPWMLSAMLYATAEEFLPEYRMGTVFYKNQGETALYANCQNMRLILFASDLLHSIEESEIPENSKTWRVSYVFKLLVNPRREAQNIPELFAQSIRKLAGPVESISLDSNHRT